MSAVKTQNQQKLSELSKGCNESFSVFHSIWCDILTGSTLLYAQDILEPPFPYKPPSMQIPFSTHRHTHIHTHHFVENILNYYLIFICLLWGSRCLEHGCSKHWTNLLNSAGGSHAYTSVRLHRINPQHKGRASYRRVSGSGFSAL